MPDRPALDRLLGRDRWITLVGVAVPSALAWVYIATGAGLGMDMRAMAPAMPATWTPALWALMIAMWWTMMVAMMTPSAAPTILLYARVHRHAVAKGPARDDLAPTGAFVAGYLLVWLGFSVAAAVLHWALERIGIVSAMTMGSQSRWLSIV